MTKLVKLTLIGMMLAPMSLNAQQGAKSFVEQYKKQDGFTVVTIGKPAMRMIYLFAKAGMIMENADAQILKFVDAVQVISFDSGRDKDRRETFNSEALAFCNASCYEELIEVVVERNETVKIFCKTEDEAITELIVLCSGSERSSVEMVCINGKFAFDDIQTVTGSFEKKLASK